MKEAAGAIVRDYVSMSALNPDARNSISHHFGIGLPDMYLLC